MEGGKTERAEKKSKIKTVCIIVIDVLFVCFFVLCMLALFLSVSAKKNADGAMQLFGYELRLVESPSMEKCDQTDVSDFEIKDLPVHSLVFIQTVPEEETKAKEWYASLKAGDVLTFRYVYTTQETITHRIVEIRQNETGGHTIVLEGDNKNSQDGALQQVIDTSDTDSPNYVIGKVTGKSLVLGFLITALKSPWGIVCIVIIPCLLIIVWEIVRVVSVFSSKKKEEIRAEQQKKDEEIAQLKRLLAEANAAGAENSLDADGLSEEKGEPIEERKEKLAEADAAGAENSLDADRLSEDKEI